MKRFTKLIFPILMLASLAGCNGNQMTFKTGDKVYYDRIVFDTSDESAANPNFYLGMDKKITSVKAGKYDIEFGYRSKVLTLSATDLRKIGTGEKRATVAFEDGKKTYVDILNCTKFIRTAEDFQNIGADGKAAEGTYVLANDIDCSSISNFEPIGQYFSETDPTNFYFHGILDGDGYAIKNVRCSYSDGPTGISGENYPSNYDVFQGNPKFSNPAHQSGDNVGIFQVIGSSGVVRNLTFDNCSVHGRTIVGIVAANCMGHVENVLIKNNCSVKMDTHFYDDDCNTGAAFGIVAGSGTVTNVVSLTTNVQIVNIDEDYGPDYAGKTGNGWDHSATEGNTDDWWRFVGVSKEVPGTSTKLIDSNNQQSNGVYSVVGKSWGEVTNSVGAAFRVVPYGEQGFNVAFGHTHSAVNKPTSGDTDLGTIENCGVESSNDLKLASTYSKYHFDNNVWDVIDGAYPSIKVNVNRFDIVK